jgi:hypothetical protein
LAWNTPLLGVAFALGTGKLVIQASFRREAGGERAIRLLGELAHAS